MTLEQQIDYIRKYKEMGLNFADKVPNDPAKNPQTLKRPDLNEWKKYQTELYDGPIHGKNGFFVFSGRTSLNLVIVDLDAPELFDHFKEYVGKTFIVKSGKKGYHVYFRVYDSNILQHLTNDKGQKVDIIGQGGGAVLPPTLHPETKQPYEIVSDCEIKQLGDIQPILLKLKDLGFRPDSKNKTIADYNQVVKEGQGRNNRSFDYARFLIHTMKFDKDTAWFEVQRHNSQLNEPPLQDDELLTLFNSAHRYPTKEALQEKDEQTQETVSKNKAIIDQTANLIKSRYSFVTLRETDDILLYDGKIYNKAKAEAIIKENAESIIENCTTHERNEVLNKIKATTGTDLENFDSDPNLITLENGILDLDNLELRPHTPENLSRVLLPVEFSKPQYEIKDGSIFEDIEKNLENTLFYQFLKRSFTVNGEFRKDDLETILEIIASPMIKRQIDEKAFMFLGGGENGKSCALDYVRLLYGDKNISRVPLQALAEDKFMAAELVGKSANVFTDLEAGEMKHTGKIKAITSGEGLQAQEKYKNPFTLIPFAKMMFSCNRFPKIYDQSQGFFRRWMIVTWERNFEKDPERDPLLREKLANNQGEKNLVFSCLVYLARKLNRLGKFTHSKDWKTTQKDWNENADPLDYFVTNYIIDSTGNRSIRDTYAHYKQVMLMKGETPLGVGQFGKVFAEYFEQWVEKDNEGRTHRVWLNIDLKPIELGDFV